MRLNVQKIINAPGERIDFQFDLDLSDVEFGGLYPIQEPVVAEFRGKYRFERCV